MTILMSNPQRGQRNDPRSVDMVVSNGAGHKCGNEVLSYLKSNTLVRLTQIWIPIWEIFGSRISAIRGNLKNLVLVESDRDS